MPLWVANEALKLKGRKLKLVGDKAACKLKVNGLIKVEMMLLWSQVLDVERGW
jgi:hypothetical protein